MRHEQHGGILNGYERELGQVHARLDHLSEATQRIEVLLREHHKDINRRLDEHEDGDVRGFGDARDRLAALSSKISWIFGAISIVYLFMEVFFTKH